MKLWAISIYYYLFIIVIAISLSKFTSAKSIDTHYPAESGDQAISSAAKDNDFLQFKSEVGTNKEPSEDVGDSQESSLYDKMRKINLQGAQSYDIPSSKRAVIDDEHLIKGYQKYKRRRSPFGIVYKDGKPIGILEPISRIYEYQNFQDDVALKNPALNKRDNTEIPIGESDNNVKRDTDNTEKTDDAKYAKVLTSFKLNGRVRSKPLVEDAAPLAKTDQKRNVEKSTKAPIEKRDNTNGDPKLSAIENNLKEIISDLNNINDDDDAVEKREVQIEDEDLDNGINKIGISKELHTSVGSKKSEPKSFDSSLKQKKSSTDLIAVDDNYEGENANRNNKRIADYRSEGENFIRQKRQQANNAAAARDGPDIVKGLETSGDLTVSGNKSPLASASAPVETESKNKITKGENFEKRDKQASEDGEYEKRLQRNIQDKISEIKEQVKREIKALKTNKNVESGNVDANENTDRRREVKLTNGNDKAHLDSHQARKKRNLLERTEEDAELDLVQNTEADSLTPHIRNRRDADDSDSEMVSDVEDRNGASWGLEKADTGKKQAEIAKREDLNRNSMTKTKRDTSDGSRLGFQTYQNQDVATRIADEEPVVNRARATRNTRLPVDAVGPLDAEKLEKLVKESASLTESIKSERGARYNDASAPHIEVELHSGSQKSQGNANAKRERTDSDTFKHDDEEAVALTENHAETSNLIVNQGSDEIVLRKRETRLKQNGSDKKQFQQKETTDAEEKAKVVDGGAAISESSSSSPAYNNHEQKFKAIESGNSKMAQESTSKASDSTSSVSSEPKAIEIRTDSPEGGSKLVEEGSKNAANSDGGEKEEKVKATSSAEKTSDNNANVVDEQSQESSNSNFEDGDANKLSGRNNDEVSMDDDKEAVNEDSDAVKIRQERKSEPNLSLEDMQELDSENNMKRKRRYVDNDYYYREKRAQYPVPNYIRLRNYRGDEDEADDESDEFDDDNFDDRTANLVRKRATQDLDNYDDLDEDYEPISNNQEGLANRVNKRNANAREFVAKMNDDAYDNSNYLYDSNGVPLNRNKRNIMEDVGMADMVALHSGGPMIRHLAAVKGRNSGHLDKENNNRRKRLEKTFKTTNGNIKNSMISGLSENDIFGALPQSYEGELTRFKRVKRDDPSASDTE